MGPPRLPEADESSFGVRHPEFRLYQFLAVLTLDGALVLS